MLIAISGMISSGKSTLSKKLTKAFPGSVLVDEFSEKDEVFNTFLSWFYNKKKNLSLGFQSYVLESHLDKVNKVISKNQHLLNSKNSHIFIDRFLIEHYIFASLGLKEKEKKYFSGYCALFEKLIYSEKLPNLVIFLDVDFVNFKDRFTKRGRLIEISTWEKNQKYYQDLHKIYKPTFQQLVKKYQINCQILDTNNLIEEQVLEKVIKLINGWYWNT